jgi:hypothetical protein
MFCAVQSHRRRQQAWYRCDLLFPQWQGPVLQQAPCGQVLDHRWLVPSGLRRRRRSPPHRGHHGVLWHHAAHFQRQQLRTCRHRGRACGGHSNGISVFARVFQEGTPTEHLGKSPRGGRHGIRVFASLCLGRTSLCTRLFPARKCVQECVPSEEAPLRQGRWVLCGIRGLFVSRDGCHGRTRAMGFQCLGLGGPVRAL